jgi:Tfp pilus assembly protein PilF
VLAAFGGALAPEATLLLGAADRLCRPSAVARSLGSPDRAQRREAPPTRARPRRAAASWRSSRETARRTPPERRGDEELQAALTAADAGRLGEAVAAVERVLASDPLDADAHFVRGVAKLGQGEAATAVEALRRALYLDPGFGFAAFQLARAYDELGQTVAARRAYQQALRVLAPDHDRQRRLAGDVDLADVAAACGARISALAS